MFFLYGARLSTAETLAGLRNWRLQRCHLATTFVVFPLLGLATQLLEGNLLRPSLASGVLLLCLVPSTVQSCVVYTRIAGGNVAGAVVSASLSNLLGVFLTPPLVALLMTRGRLGGRRLDRADRPAAVRRRSSWGSCCARGSAASSPGTTAGSSSSTAAASCWWSSSPSARDARAHVWSSLSVWSVLAVGAVCAALLAVAMGWTVVAGRVLGFSRADRIAMLFCGSNKSLASGLPIATVLFAGGDVALIILPLMLYHQLQIITGAVLAGRLERSAP